MPSTYSSKESGGSLGRLFTEHPASVGETYVQHLRSALSFAAEMLRLAAMCGIHALLPFLFANRASRRIAVLYDRMVLNRSRPVGDPAFLPQVPDAGRGRCFSSAPPVPGRHQGMTRPVHS